MQFNHSLYRRGTILVSLKFSYATLNIARFVWKRGKLCILVETVQTANAADQAQRPASGYCKLTKAKDDFSTLSQKNASNNLCPFCWLHGTGNTSTESDLFLECPFQSKHSDICMSLKVHKNKLMKPKLERSSLVAKQLLCLGSRVFSLT